MANTIKDVALVTSQKTVVKYITLSSDGSEETDLVIYDSSALASTIGISDPLDCTIVSVKASASTAATARIFLEWDATTDVLALDIPPGQWIDLDFRAVGGLPNQAGSGITGDILLTTTGLESGDKLMLLLEVRPN